jgi:hypothetical protein
VVAEERARCSADLLKKDLSLRDRLSAVKKARAVAYEKGNRHAVEALGACSVSAYIPV